MVVRIVEHDPAWPGLYEELSLPLSKAFGEYALDIQHVGSTSVPRIASKPVIDIAVAIAKYPLPGDVIRAVEKLGYEHRSEFGIPHRHYFRKGGPGEQAVHVHANVLGSEAWLNQTTFRDYLRAHAERARQYEALKRELAQQYASDAEAYTESKSAFILETLDEARNWRPLES
ncbi:MAG: GrpB family protein [Chloroflexota bacterium]|nr:GrpB family protein [Chloroflexota bacterium]